MKCDELKDRWFTAYPTDSICKAEVYGRKEVDAAIDELKAENERLKDDFGGTTIAYNQVCDEYEQCDKELRATKRALWMARADRANAEFFFWNNLAFHKKYGITKFSIKRNWFDVKPNQTVRTPYMWAEKWYDVSYYCKKKAEEYK